MRREHVFLRRSKRQKFGELLLTNGNITPEQLSDALKVQGEGGGLLGDILLEKGFITETEIVRVLSTQYGLPVLRSKDYEVDKNLVAGFSAEFLYRNILMPFDRIADLVLVLVCDLPGDEVIAMIEKNSMSVVFYVSSQSDIQSALMRYKPVSDEERRLYLSLRRGLRRSPANAVAPAESSEPEVEVALSESADQDPSQTWNTTTSFEHSQSLTESTILGASEVLGETDELVIQGVPGEVKGPAGRPRTTSAAENDLLSGLDKSWESIFDAAEENLKKEPTKDE